MMKKSYIIKIMLINLAIADVMVVKKKTVPIVMIVNVNATMSRLPR
jgi:hypothetical protein